MKRKPRRLAEEKLNLLLTVLKIVREIMLILSMAINYVGERGRWLTYPDPGGCTSSS